MLQDFVQIDCGEMLTIAQVSEVFAQLSVAFEQRKTVSIDVSQLSRVDAAAVQLLYCFQQDAASQKMITIWTEPSEQFAHAISMLGLPPFYVTQ